MATAAGMPAGRAYLDHNASAPLLSAARDAMAAALDTAVNPSSVHAEGRAARRMIEEAREKVAALCGAGPEDVIFTSGATEAASTLLAPEWRKGRSPLVFSRGYVLDSDHPSIRGGGRFAPGPVTRLPVDRDGVADPDTLARALEAHDRAEGAPLVALHAANNETGVIQPLAEIGAVVRRAQGTLVVDAVQAAGRIPLDLGSGCGDFLILSAHKIGGPTGVGAIVGPCRAMMPLPLASGGGQERGHRAGTENVAGIAGFGAAASAALAALARIEAVQALRDLLERRILAVAPDAAILGAGAPRIANTCLFAVPGLDAATAQIAFDLAGIALSAGSACSSGRVGPSHVVRAMGRDNADGALRVSIGPATTVAEVERFAAVLGEVLARARRKPRAA